MNWSGVWTALLTPFRNGAVDEASLEKLFAHQVKNGVRGFVINGTTGESPVLSREERERIFKLARAQTKVSLMMGTGTNDTAETVRRTQEAQAMGADAALVVVPYYNKPPQRGLVEHFRAVASCTTLPIFLYNVPGRTITGLTVESIAELAKVKNIVGIKEATGNIERAQWLIQEAPEDFAIYSGDDPTAIALMYCGGRGNVSVTANVAPKLMHELCVAAIAGSTVEANRIQKHLMPLHRALFLEANPIPVKWAMQRMGLCGGALRLPLTPLSLSVQAQVESALVAAQLL